MPKKADTNVSKNVFEGSIYIQCQVGNHVVFIQKKYLKDLGRMHIRYFARDLYILPVDLDEKTSPHTQALKWIKADKLELATALLNIMEERPDIIKKLERSIKEARKKKKESK